MGACLAKPVDGLPITARIASNPAVPNDAKPIQEMNNLNNNNSTPREHIKRPANSDGASGSGRGVIGSIPSSGKIVIPNLKMFSLAQLKHATRNFRPDSVLGEGGFGTVYKGWINEITYAPSKVNVGMPVAVKKSNPDSEQGLKEWQAEVKFLGKFSHPNLVKLLGYCWEEKHFLLVYEYMQKGSLETHLFRKDVAEQFSWDTRIKIAIEAACGLAFLHTTEKQVIYRDFKAANILLDKDFNAKLSDFGLAKLGPVDGKSHVTTNVVGTYGYAAPEYVATGHLYLKSDVYGFGVVLLEMITGQRVLDPQRPPREINLVDWARPFLPDMKKLTSLMDPRLEKRYPPKGAFEMAQLILRCTEPDQKCRPGMEEVLETLQHISSIRMEQKKFKHKARGGGGGGRQRSPLQNNNLRSPRDLHTPDVANLASRARGCERLHAAWGREGFD